MIARIWHGYTTPENAGTYEHLLTSEIIPGIAAKRIPGYLNIQVLKRVVGQEVEFTTIMWFDALESIQAFTGVDYEKAYVPASARAVLSRFDERSIHCELRHESQSTQ